MAAISAGETPALPRGSERLHVGQLHSVRSALYGLDKGKKQDMTPIFKIPYETLCGIPVAEASHKTLAGSKVLDSPPS